MSTPETADDAGQVVVEQIAVDEAGLRAWYDVMSAAEAERPVFLWPPFDAALAVFTQTRPDRDIRFFLARRDGDVVGVGRLDLSIGENEHLGMLKVLVAPEHRRRGVGSALLTALEASSFTAGRGTLLGQACAPPGVPDAAGPAFAAARGYAVAGREQVKTVDLPATADRWAELESHAPPGLDGYRLLWWLDPAPEEHAASLCHLFTRFVGEIPLGDVDLKPQVWDVARLRQAEARRAAAGTQHLLVAAQAPDGSLAGCTDVRLMPGMRHSDLDGTLVLPEHRGHGLGLAMKVLLHRCQHDLFPEVPVIATGNADVNRWMNAVNEQLGYEVVEDQLELQRVLA